MAYTTLQVTYSLETLFNEASAQRERYHVPPEYDPETNWGAAMNLAMQRGYDQFLSAISQWQAEGYNAVITDAPLSGNVFAGDYKIENTDLEQFRKGRLKPVKLEL